jgi:hypothetical protein
MASGLLVVSPNFVRPPENQRMASVMTGLLHSMYRRWLIPFASLVLIVACSGDGPSDPGQQFGSLVVPIEGLPNGAPAVVTVSGPGGYSKSVTATTTLEQLVAGTYSVTAADVLHEGSTWSGSPASQTYNVTAGTSLTAPPVSYALATGAISITLAGLPQSANAAIVITGPGNYSLSVTAATEIRGLVPGQYSLEARDVQLTSARYASTSSVQAIMVTASLTPILAQVVYSRSTGALQVSISGLPAGADAAVTVWGPANFSRTLTRETVIENLAPGTYQLAAQHVVAGSVFVPAPTVQQVTVTASEEATLASITYISSGTSLSVQVTGLPSHRPAKLTLTGPAGFVRQVAGSEIISGLVVGTYTLTAQPVTDACAAYSPVPASQAVTLNAGQGAAATVAYSQGSGNANLCIEGAYITQSVQAFDGSVPLVAGRNGLLRVFVRASTSNAAQPQVRVRFYDAGGALVSTMLLSAPAASVPQFLDEGTLASSWNTPVSGAFLQPGLRMLLDVDPGNSVAEPDESDNMFPLNGQPKALDVRQVSTMFVTLVPVVQSARGDSGRVSEANKASFLLPMQRMFPVADIDAQVRAPYTFTGSELLTGGNNWITLLSEINAMRVAEGTGRIYYGVVRVGYTSGVAGLGYISAPAAIGWDHQPSATEVMAHELGHNFGRVHAPCGGPLLTDGSYPYGGAEIGVSGYDILSGSLQSSSLKDLMSYCHPHWISDYTYRNILDFRSVFYPPVGASRTPAPSQRGLLIWGRIDKGRVVLEPAIEVDAPPSLPSQSGPHRLEGFGPSGEALFSIAFNGERVADTQDAGDQTFAFVIPVTQLRGVGLDRLRLSARGRQVEQRRGGGNAVATARREATNRVRVTWNAGAAQVAMVRDAQTGRILSFSRGGSVDLRTSSAELELTLSDGVRNTRTRVRPQ